MAQRSEDEQYSFYGRLTEAFPSQVNVDFTEVCNLACVHCPHPTFKESRYYSAKYLDPALNTKIVDEVRTHGGNDTKYIRYASEGEPLVHTHAYDMLDYAVQHSGVFVTLTTNGTIMNEKRTKRLLDAGVHMIDISIDAFRPDTYAKIRVGGDLEVTSRNVQNLIRWVREQGAVTKVVVSFIEQPNNLDEAQPFKAFWEGEGASFVVIRRLHSAAGAIVRIAEDMRKENEQLTRRPCVYPWERVVLNPRGYLAFCPADWTHGSTIVNYADATLKKIWTGEFYQALRRAHLSNDFSCHGFCGQCPDWRQTRWPAEGRAYADMVDELQHEIDATQESVS